MQLFRTLVATVVVATSAFSTAAQAGDYAEYEELQAIISSLEAQKIYAPGELQRIFEDVSRQDRILELIARPAEKSREWKDYRPIFMRADRIQAGVDFWNTHANTLQRAEAEFGVPASMIVAILGVETKFGSNKGGFKVIEALSTLGLDYPPRAKFFRNELREFLILSKASGFDPREPKGSYAGAMGYPQFMPSSWRRLAIDYDGDGRINLFDSPIDAIGSIANYFKANGWRRGETVVVPARISGNDYDSEVSTSLKTTSTLAALAKTGLAPKTALSLPSTTAVSGLRLQGDHGGEFWLAFNNFFVITTYNRSILYAMAAQQLAEAIDSAYRAQSTVAPTNAAPVVAKTAALASAAQP